MLRHLPPGRHSVYVGVVQSPGLVEGLFARLLVMPSLLVAVILTVDDHSTSFESFAVEIPLPLVTDLRVWTYLPGLPVTLLNSRLLGDRDALLLPDLDIAIGRPAIRTLPILRSEGRTALEERDGRCYQDFNLCVLR